MGLRDYVAYLKSECEPRANICVFATLPCPFVTHETSARCVRTCLYSLLSVSLSSSLAFLCSRSETEWPREVHEYEPSQMNRARACAPSLILSHDRNLFAYDLLYSFPLSKSPRREKNTILALTTRKPTWKSRDERKPFFRFLVCTSVALYLDQLFSISFSLCLFLFTDLCH